MAETVETVTDGTSITQETPVGEEPAEEPDAEEETAPEESGIEGPADDGLAEETETPTEDLEPSDDPDAETPEETPAEETPAADPEDSEAVETLDEEGEEVPADETPTENALPNPGDIVEKVYSVDPFDAAYSAGYFCMTDAVGHGIPYKENIGWPGWIGTNTARSEDIYVDHHNGVCMNGTYLDVREYTWMEGTYTYYSIDNDGGNGAEGSWSVGGHMYREFHFYEAGHLGDPDYETTFRGILKLDDNDKSEGYSFYQGLAGIWLTSDTSVRREDTYTWKGIVDGGSDYHREYSAALWAEVEGTPSAPLTISYWQIGGHHSRTNYKGTAITYHLRDDAGYAIPDGANKETVTYCVPYGHYTLMGHKDYRYYEFDGWYTDADLTEEAPSQLMVTEDQDFYGAYTKVAGRIDTEVVGGTITDPVDYVNYGEDVTIEYAPNEGYVLERVTVDGELVDPDEYDDTYVFTDIQDDHAISVVYVRGEAPVKAVSKGGVDVADEVLQHGDEVRYSITVQNPTTQVRNMQVYDEVDARLSICAAEDGGVIEGQRITWTLENVPAGGEVTVHFRAAVIGQSTEQEIGNIAYLQMSGSTLLPSNEVVIIAAPVPQTPTTDTTTHTTRHEHETVRTVSYENVTVPAVAVPTVVPVATPVVEAPAAQPVVAGIATTGDDSQIWIYLAAAGAAALTLGAWFAHNARRMS